MRKVIFYLLICISLISCSQKSYQYNTLRKLLNSKLNNFEDLISENKCSYDSQKYSVIYYVDSTICFSCRALGWDKLIDEMEDSIGENVQSYLIVSSSSSFNVEKMIKRAHMKHTVLIDYDNSFIKTNKFPQSDLMKSMIVNSDQCITAIGNPLINKRIKQLFIKQLKNKSKETISSE